MSRVTTESPIQPKGRQMRYTTDTMVGLDKSYPLPSEVVDTVVKVGKKFFFCVNLDFPCVHKLFYSSVCWKN